MINTLPCCTLLVLRLYCKGVKFLGLSLPNLKPRPNENCHSFSTTNFGENRETIWELPQSRLISRLHAIFFAAWGSLKMLDKQPSWHSNCYGETSWNMTITRGSLFFFPNIFRQTQIKPTSTKKTESGCHVNTEDFFKNQSLSPCRTWQHLAHHPSPTWVVIRSIAKMQMELIGRITGWSALIHQCKRNTSDLCGMYKVSSGIYRKYWDWARKTQEIPQQKLFTQQKWEITTRCGDVVGYILYKGL